MLAMNDDRDNHDMFYCIKCNEFRVSNDVHVVFYTGFHREGETDYPLGICALHQDKTDDRHSQN